MSPSEGELRALDEIADRLNRKLDSAGLARTDNPNFWGILYDFLRCEFGYDDDDFLSMNLARLEPILDRYLIASAPQSSSSAIASAPGENGEEDRLYSWKKPADWDSKKDNWKAFGIALLIHDYIPNKKLASYVDQTFKVKCPYASTWEAASTDEKFVKFITDVRRWVGKPGRVPGKPMIQ